MIINSREDPLYVFEISKNEIVVAKNGRDLSRPTHFHSKKENAFPAKPRGECRLSAGRQFRKLLAS